MITASKSSGRRRNTDLPAEVTSFVGRRHEVAVVKHLLSESHLVTLTGPGGVGKTRLALRAAAEVGRSFPGGVHLVELAELDSPKLIAATVIAALDIQQRSSQSAEDILIEHLDGRRSLLILDNCEHVLQESALLAERLSRVLPELRILATSRQSLGTASEHTYTLLPLPSRGTESAVPCATSDAARLFVERARAVLPDFALTEQNRDVVERICRHLDGLPLAIELAAVRLRVLSAEQLLDRLDDRFRLLTAGSRAGRLRHRTLRALIDWSHALCTERERLLWSRISVFTGSLDLEAAEAVCAGDGIAREEIIDVITGLVEKSVLVREECAGRVRYRLLDTIRQYGRERLVASGQETTMKHRYRDYYRSLSHEVSARLFGPAQIELFTRLRVEHPNLRTALEYCHAENAGLCIDMASDLCHHWITGCYLGEGRNWLEQGLLDTAGRSEVRARAMWACGWLAILQGDKATAMRMLAKSRELGERFGLESVLGYVVLEDGIIAMQERDTESAIMCFDEAVARHRATGDPTGEVQALIQLALAHSFAGDAESAVAAAGMGIAICEAHGERWHKAYALAALGIETWRQGDTRRAATLAEESLRLSRSLNDLPGSGLSVEALAWIAATEEQYARAGELLGALGNIWAAIGTPLSGYGYLSRYHDESAARTRAALGDPAYRAAVRRGAQISYEEALAQALGEGPAAARSAAGAARSSPLTPREMEIARLVSQGKSNREIAASLVIAQRTAEGHVEHILTKLGFNSRAQIATWIAEQPGRAPEPVSSAGE